MNINNLFLVGVLMLKKLYNRFRTAVSMICNSFGGGAKLKEVQVKLDTMPVELERPDEAEDDNKPLRFPSKFEIDRKWLSKPFGVVEARRKTVVKNIVVGQVAIHLKTNESNVLKNWECAEDDVLRWVGYLLNGLCFTSCKTFGVGAVLGNNLTVTAFAYQIAIKMAQISSGPILLIDGNMRSGVLERYLIGESSSIGLIEVLSFRNGFGEAVVLYEKEPNLHLLSCGQLKSIDDSMDDSMDALLEDGRFGELLKTLKKYYTKIIVLLPSVLEDATSLFLAKEVDSVVLCTCCEKVTFADVDNAFRDLTFTGGCVNGIVCNSDEKIVDD
jgi:hypothetical protein